MSGVPMSGALSQTRQAERRADIAGGAAVLLCVGVGALLAFGLGWRARELELEREIAEADAKAAHVELIAAEARGVMADLLHGICSASQGRGVDAQEFEALKRRVERLAADCGAEVAR